MIRVPPECAPCSCGGAHRSSPITVAPRRASASAVAEPMVPSPTTITSAMPPRYPRKPEAVYPVRFRRGRGTRPGRGPDGGGTKPSRSTHRSDRHRRPLAPLRCRLLAGLVLLRTLRILNRRTKGVERRLERERVLVLLDPAENLAERLVVRGQARLLDRLGQLAVHPRLGVLVLGHADPRLGSRPPEPVDPARQVVADG